MGCAHYFQAPDKLARSRLSDSGEDAKEKSRKKLALREKVSSRFIF